MSIDDNVLGCFPDREINLHSPLVAERSSELKIIQRDVVIDRLDTMKLSTILFVHSLNIPQDILIGQHISINSGHGYRCSISSGISCYRGDSGDYQRTD